MTSKQPALFVSHYCALSDAMGGVQRCTREYLTTLKEAGFDPKVVEFRDDRRFLVRLRRKFYPQPYRDRLPTDLAERCHRAAEDAGAQWIFLNHTNPLSAVPAMRALDGATRRFYVFLSHGADSTDYLLESGFGGTAGTKAASLFLGRMLFAEAEQRKHLDAVFCLSSQDESIEKWLGSRRTLVLPRICPPDPLVSRPVKGRIGTVATLSHGPNIDGVRLAAEALLAHPAVTLRLVGGPQDQGEYLAREFRNVEYVGRLDDEALAKEAETWACFLNPIFPYAKGASTKLAVPLGWQLPIATTAAGARGYVWDAAVIPLLDSPEALAARAADLASQRDYENERVKTARIAGLAPTTTDLGTKVRDFLRSVSAG
jgi:hypothetical protein